MRMELITLPGYLLRLVERFNHANFCLEPIMPVPAVLASAGKTLLPAVKEGAIQGVTAGVATGVEKGIGAITDKVTQPKNPPPTDIA